jgi:hypothetical protein
MLANLAGWQRVRASFGPLPITSLEARYSEDPPFCLSRTLWQRFRAGWHTMHDDLSVRADNLLRIPVDCGHVIMNERPDLVVDAILSQIERFRVV